MSRTSTEITVADSERPLVDADCLMSKRRRSDADRVELYIRAVYIDYIRIDRVGVEVQSRACARDCDGLNAATIESARTGSEKEHPPGGSP